MKVKIVNIKQNTPEKDHGLTQWTVYADLVEVESGRTLICATLEYVARAISAQGLELVIEK